MYASENAWKLYAPFIMDYNLIAEQINSNIMKWRSFECSCSHLKSIRHFAILQQFTRIFHFHFSFIKTFLPTFALNGFSLAIKLNSPPIPYLYFFFFIVSIPRHTIVFYKIVYNRQLLCYYVTPCRNWISSKTDRFWNGRDPRKLSKNSFDKLSCWRHCRRMPPYICGKFVQTFPIYAYRTRTKIINYTNTAAAVWNSSSAVYTPEVFARLLFSRLINENCMDKRTTRNRLKNYSKSCKTVEIFLSKMFRFTCTRWFFFFFFYRDFLR